MTSAGRQLLRSTLVLMTGTGAAQAVGFMAAPVLSRLYSPSDFGALGAFTSLLAILGIFATLRYTQAIVLPEDDFDARHLLAVSLLSAMLFSIAVSVLIATVGSTRLMTQLRMESLSRVLWVLPLALAASGAYQSLSYFTLRTRNLGRVARAKIVQSAAQTVMQLGASAGGALALVGGVATGAVVASAMLWRADSSRVSRREPLTLARMLAVAKRYKRFPLIDTWGAALNGAGLHMPPLLVTFLLGPSSAGMYVLAHRVLSLPSSLVGRAVADAFLSGAPEAHRTGDLGVQVGVIFRFLSRVSMPVVVLMIAFGESAFAIVFGEEWREAGRVASWLAPWSYFVFITSPLTTLPSVLERQGTSALIQLGFLVSRTAALFVGIRFGGLELGIAAFSLVSCAWLLINAAWLMRAAGATVKTLITIPVDALMVMGALAPIPLVRHLAADGTWEATAIAVAASIVLVYAYIRSALRLAPSHRCP